MVDEQGMERDVAEDDESSAAADSPFYRLPAVAWSALDVEVTSAVGELAADLAATARAWPGAAPLGDGVALTPVELALRLGQASGQLLGAISAEQADLRQVIATLRTALALCWDMYSADETGRVSVGQHMERLRASIVEFEADLRQLQDGA